MPETNLVITEVDDNIQVSNQLAELVHKMRVLSLSIQNKLIEQPWMQTHQTLQTAVSTIADHASVISSHHAAAAVGCRDYSMYHCAYV